LKQKNIDEGELSSLNREGCFKGFDFCRVRYTKAGPESGCSCKKDLGPREFKMGNNTCKDLSSRESSDNNFQHGLTNKLLSRILDEYIPKHEQPLVEGQQIRVYRICTCSENLCNVASKLRNSSTTRGVNSFNTIDSFSTNTNEQFRNNMTETKQMKFFTTTKLFTISSTKMLKTIGQETASSHIEALGSNNSWLHILIIFLLYSLQ